MNREEILRKAQKENKKGDELEFESRKTAATASHIINVAIIAIMLQTSVIQGFQGKPQIANPLVFIIQLIIISAVSSITLFYYHRKKIYIIAGIIEGIIAIILFQYLI